MNLEQIVVMDREVQNIIKHNEAEAYERESRIKKIEREKNEMRNTMEKEVGKDELDEVMNAFDMDKKKVMDDYASSQRSDSDERNTAREELNKFFDKLSHKNGGKRRDMPDYLDAIIACFDKIGGITGIAVKQGTSLVFYNHGKPIGINGKYVPQYEKEGMKGYNKMFWDPRFRSDTLHKEN